MGGAGLGLAVAAPALPKGLQRLQEPGEEADVPGARGVVGAEETEAAVDELPDIRGFAGERRRLVRFGEDGCDPANGLADIGVQEDAGTPCGHKELAQFPRGLSGVAFAKAGGGPEGDQVINEARVRGIEFSNGTRAPVPRGGAKDAEEEEAEVELHKGSHADVDVGNGFGRPDF